MPNVFASRAEQARTLTQLVDSLTRTLLNAEKALIGERSRDMTGDLREALALINEQRAIAGLDPITPAEAEQWPGQLTEEPNHA